MNDHELDRLLNLWEAPHANHSLRGDLRARFPQGKKLGFIRPVRWAFTTLLASAVLAIALAGAVAIAQSNETFADLPVIRTLSDFYQNFLEARQAQRAKNIAVRIAASEPRIFVDGVLSAPLQLGPSATIDVQLPGGEVYSITAFPMERRTADERPTGWVEAGRISGNVIEFQAGARRVRIECNQPIGDRDLPVFAIRR